MKKNFFQIITSCLALILGFSSCKKDNQVEDNGEKTPTCIRCFDSEDSYEVIYTFCQGDRLVETEEDFDAHAAYLQSLGNTVTVYEKCGD